MLLIHKTVCAACDGMYCDVMYCEIINIDVAIICAQLTRGMVMGMVGIPW